MFDLTFIYLLSIMPLADMYIHLVIIFLLSIHGKHSHGVKKKKGFIKTTCSSALQLAIWTGSLFNSKGNRTICTIV